MQRGAQVADINVGSSDDCRHGSTRSAVAQRDRPSLLAGGELDGKETAVRNADLLAVSHREQEALCGDVDEAASHGLIRVLHED